MDDKRDDRVNNYNTDNAGSGFQYRSRFREVAQSQVDNKPAEHLPRGQLIPIPRVSDQITAISDEEEK